MKLRYALAASAAAFALGFGAPALAQDNNDNNDNNDVNVAANGSLNASQGGEVDTVADDASNAASRGGELDTTASNGSNAASRGGEIEVGNTEFDTQATNGSNAASRGGEIDIGNSTIVADQELKAIIINKYLDEVVDLDGEDETDTAVGYNSGQNQIRGNAFAAYAGILNQAWNTGINANTQAATNMAAQGTVNFGSNGDGDNGGGNGD